ncbi:MAG: hypothetical protein HRT72_12650 [Flavobacteriales bacterium]|nr:hypothetical protein [Flavobacteriales bacterium]
MRLSVLSSILFFVIIFNRSAFGQGCGDAGLCSVGAIQTGFSDDDISSTFRASQLIGIGEQNVFISTTQIEGYIPTNQKGVLYIRFPFKYINGNLGSNAGFGDFTFSYSLKHEVGENTNLYYIIGAKYFQNDANVVTKKGLPLPMVYQTSLGTNDLLFGVKVVINKWKLSVGYQKVFGTNKNGFTHDAWSNSENALAYLESRKLSRGDDILLRIERAFIGEKLEGQVGLLPIIRLQKDEIVIDSSRVVVNGSNGLTLNLTAGVNTPLSEKTNLKLNMGFPIVSRKNRVDGLTRSFVFSSILSFAINK